MERRGEASVFGMLKVSVFLEEVPYMLGTSSCCRMFQELGVGDRGFSELGQEVIRDAESEA